jgi:hypothetical protein
MSSYEDLKVQGDPISKRGAQSQQQRNDDRPHVGSACADAGNINNDNENRVLGRDRRMRHGLNFVDAQNR